MKELALNILDVAKNSVSAGATEIKITLNEDESLLEIDIEDDGVGMTEEVVKNASDPFYTTRTTRPVGLGLPFLKMEAEMTGGSFYINSKPIKEFENDHGTIVKAVFHKDHIDYIGLGDIISTIITLIMGSPEIDFLFVHNFKTGKVDLDTKAIKLVLGSDIPIDSPQVVEFMKDSLSSEYLKYSNLNK